MKKDRPKNLGAAAKRVEKKKQKERGREIGKQHKQAEQLQSENRKLEQEFSQIAVSLAMKNTVKMSTNPLLVKKLSAINDMRMQLDLMTKTMADQMQVIKDAKKEAKQILKAQKQKADAPVYDEFKLDPQYDWQDLSYIKIPDGVAPDTEGQIFKSLKQLRSIKQIPKREKSAIPSSSNVLPTPPKLLPSNSTALLVPPLPPPPAFLPPNGLSAPPVPKFMPPTPTHYPVPPPTFLGPSGPIPAPSFTVPGSIPPPPPLFNNGAPPPPTRFNPAQAIPSPPRLAKHFPKTSQAPKDSPVFDPLNPEKDLDLSRKQEQSKSVVTITAEPKLRDLQKEVAHMVPASLLRNQAKK